MAGDIIPCSLLTRIDKPHVSCQSILSFYKRETFHLIHKLLATPALLLYNVKKKGKVKALIDYILIKRGAKYYKKGGYIPVK